MGFLKLVYTEQSEVLRNPRINLACRQTGLTNSLSQACPKLRRRACGEFIEPIIKAFQNPVWAEQVRERLKQIKILMSAHTQTSSFI
jgi:hypothetical protein